LIGIVALRLLLGVHVLMEIVHLPAHLAPDANHRHNEVENKPEKQVNNNRPKDILQHGNKGTPMANNKLLREAPPDFSLESFIQLPYLCFGKKNRTEGNEIVPFFISHDD
jgi:hypothetical protein